MHIAGASGRPEFNRMETTMTKSKITAVTLTALTLAGTLAATSGTAQAHHWGTGVDIGIAAGALIGAAAVTSGPVYVTPGYSCRLVERYDRWGNTRVIRVCGY
jgi:NhaP-type Na+/H+ or K+/H+ antiporter